MVFSLIVVTRAHTRDSSRNYYEKTRCEKEAINSQTVSEHQPKAKERCSGSYRLADSFLSLAIILYKLLSRD